MPAMRVERNEGYAYRARVGPGGVRGNLLDYLSSRWTHSTRSEWLARLRDGQVLLDGRAAGPTDVPRPNQILVWNRPPWDEPVVPLDFAVLYRDADLLGVAKPSGLPVLPGGGFLKHTLLGRVRSISSEASPLHRLGRGTSGVVLFSLNKKAAALLAGGWHDRVCKVYRALVSGDLERDHFEVNVPIGPVPHRVLGSVHAASPAGRPAQSIVRMLERRGAVTLVEVEIITGRSHQIRVHLAAAGFPIHGDPLYPPGGVPPPECTVLPGECGYLLHHAKLAFSHPRTSRRVEIRCAPPPVLRRAGEQ